MTKRYCLVRGCNERPLNTVALCRAHNMTHEVVEEACPGEAHRPEVAGCIDHCMACMPGWGVIHVAKPRQRACLCPEIARSVRAHRPECEEF